MAVVSCDGKSHSSAIQIDAFSLSSAEEIAAVRSCFARMVMGLAGSPSVNTSPAPSLSAPVVAEPLG